MKNNCCLKPKSDCKKKHPNITVRVSRIQEFYKSLHLDLNQLLKKIKEIKKFPLICFLEKAFQEVHGSYVKHGKKQSSSGQISSYPKELRNKLTIISSNMRHSPSTESWDSPHQVEVHGVDVQLLKEKKYIHLPFHYC